MEEKKRVLDLFHHSEHNNKLLKETFGSDSFSFVHSIIHEYVCVMKKQNT